MWARQLIAQRTWSTVFAAGFAFWVVVRVALPMIGGIPAYTRSAAAWRAQFSASPEILVVAACILVAIGTALALDTRRVQNAKEAGTIGLLLGLIGVIWSVGAAFPAHAVEYAIVRGGFILAIMVILSIVLYAFRGGDLTARKRI